MAKNFAPRVSKRQRKTIDLSEGLGSDVFKLSDDKLLQGAKLDQIRLADIVVKEQVRTKFNDSSLKDLAENIKANGLIQPLVLHRKGSKYTLICGERRFRAMSLIDMKVAPCFVLEGKTEDELMAIQFSENSSREALHYIDKADGILNYKKTTKASERKIQAALGISKSEVHRSLLIAKLPKKMKEAAKKHDIEKYVLVEFDALEKSTLKKALEKMILSGDITKRAQLKKAIKSGSASDAKASKSSRARSSQLPRGLTANAFLKAMQSKSKDLEMDSQTRKALQTLLEQTKEAVDM